MEQQEAFDFRDEPRGPPSTEPTRPGEVTSEGDQYVPLLR